MTGRRICPVGPRERVVQGWCLKCDENKKRHVVNMSASLQTYSQGSGNLPRETTRDVLDTEISRPILFYSPPCLVVSTDIHTASTYIGLIVCLS